MNTEKKSEKNIEKSADKNTGYNTDKNAGNSTERSTGKKTGTVIEEKAYAKLNISLDVTGRRDDGFHNMKMVMQTVSLCDDISIELRDEPGIWAKSNLQYIPSDDRNLAVKAARMFFREAGIEGTGAVVSMRKSIPVGAGLAGGSADAAAVLRALNRYYRAPCLKKGFLPWRTPPVPM